MQADINAFKNALCNALQCSSSDARRAFHGRGQTVQGLEGVCVDFFEPLAVVSLFSEYSAEFVADLLAILNEIVVQQNLAARFTTVLVQHRYRKPCETEIIVGDLPAQPMATECGQQFELNLTGNQNIGFFLDAKPARDWLRQNCAGAKVLNLFAYTCAFSVAALAGDAKRVVNIDMSRNALRIGERNHAHNFDDVQLANNRARFMPHEIFRSVSRLAKNGPYDLIVIDPPSFQPGSFVAKTDYAKLVRKLPRLLRRGGKVLAMLNAPNMPAEFLRTTIADNFPELKYLSRLENSLDFPDADPDRSLKMMVFECQRQAQHR